MEREICGFRPISNLKWQLIDNDTPYRDHFYVIL